MVVTSRLQEKEKAKFKSRDPRSKEGRGKNEVRRKDVMEGRVRKGGTYMPNNDAHLF